MFDNLDASNFRNSSPFYEKEFETILSKIVDCYHMMIADQIELPNDENKIRDKLLLKYLKNNRIRKMVGLTSWYFEREVQEDSTVGRTDIKIISPDSFLNTSAYYIIECKRIDNKNVLGVSGLNSLYINKGICRFTSVYYSSYYQVNGMIGFVVKKMDISKNVDILNQLLGKQFPKSIIKKNITQACFITNFAFHYESIFDDRNGNPLKIYHLMLDFHENIDRLN